MTHKINFKIYDALVNEAYKIGTGAATLQSFSDLFMQAFPSQLQAFHGYDLYSEFKVLTGRSGYDPALMRMYDDCIRSGMKNPYAEHLKNDGFSKRLKFGQEYILDVELKKTDFYNSFLLPSGDVSQTYGMTVFVEKNRLLHWGINFNERYNDEAEKAQMMMFSLVPHLRRAIELSRKLENIVGLNRSLQAALDMFSTAAIICDSSMKIIFANNEAEKIFFRGDLVSSINGKIFFTSSADNLTAREMVKSLATDTFSMSARRYELFRVLSSISPPCLAFICPLPKESNEDFSFNFLSERQVLILLINPARNSVERVEVLSALFGLTNAEASLAYGFSSGMSLREYSDQHQISYNTVRVQMQSIINKMGVRRQSDVVKFVGNIMSSINI